MLYKPNRIDKGKAMAGITCLVLLASTGGQALASTPGSILDNIKITNTEGITSGTLPKLDGTIESLIKQPTNNPNTWGNFMSKAKISEGDSKVNQESLEFIVKYNQGKEPLVMTKEEVFNSIKVLVELNAKDKLNQASDFRLMTIINSLSVGRNYLLTNDIEHLFSRLNTLKVDNGVISESLLGKIVSLDGTSVTMDIIVPGVEGNVIRERFQINTDVPWKMGTGVYELRIEGNIIKNMEPKYDVKYGTIESKNGDLYLNNKKVLTGTHTKNTKTGDYIEYIDVDNNIQMLNNLGTPTTYVVRGIDSNSIYTLEGKDLGRGIVFTDKDGLNIDPRKLDKYEVISLFSNGVAMVTKDESDHELRYSKGTIYLDGIGYPDKGVWINDGKKAVPLSYFQHTAYLKNVKVSKDVKGNPKMLTIEPIEFTVAVTGTKGDKIQGNHIEGAIDIDKVWTYNSEAIRNGYVYNMIIIDNQIIEAESVRSVRFTTDWLNENYISTGYRDRNRYYVDEDILVMVDEGADDKGTTKPSRTIKYSELLKEYSDKIKSGDMNVTVYYEGDNAVLLKVKYNPIEGLRKDNELDKTPLGLLKASAIDVKGDVYKITLGDGKGTASFTLSATSTNLNMLKKIEDGAFVLAEFDRKGALYSVTPYVLQEKDLTTKGLSKYLELTKTTMPTLGYVQGDSELTSLRAMYPMYEEDGESFRVVDKLDLIGEKDYYIFREGGLVRISILKGE